MVNLYKNGKAAEIFEKYSLSMKKLILISTLLFSFNGWAEDCRNASKYNEKLKMNFPIIVGKPYCVMGPYSVDDSEMIADWWVESNELNILLNNIRVGRDIDLLLYGFNDGLKQSLSSRIDNINTVNFIKRFASDGQLILSVNKRLNELKSKEVNVESAQICIAIIREAKNRAKAQNQEEVYKFLSFMSLKAYLAFKKEHQQLNDKSLDKAFKVNQKEYESKIDECIDFWKVSDRLHPDWEV